MGTMMTVSNGQQQQQCATRWRCNGEQMARGVGEKMGCGLRRGTRFGAWAGEARVHSRTSSAAEVHQRQQSQ